MTADSLRQLLSRLKLKVWKKPVAQKNVVPKTFLAFMT